jgi:hypothetical protein
VKRALIPILLLAVLLPGCRTAPTLPPVDLRAAGWMVRQGQAVWTSARGAAGAAGVAGVAGELVVAIGADGACFVQFVKPPFTLVTARAQAGAWTLELPQTRRHYHGRGQPPTRFVWFALADAVAGRLPVGDWEFEEDGPTDWRLTNARTGETLAGYFTP